MIVSWEPEPSRTPPEVKLPERMMMRLEPRLLIWSSTRACAPAPTATIVITAPTPMMMPSIVSIERSLLTRSASSATLSVARKFMRPPARPGGRCAAHLRGGILRFVRHVADEPAVAERQKPRRERRDVLLVRDDDHRDAAAVQLLQQRHDLEARRGVERAGRLVGENQLGVVDQRARDGDALLLAAGELRRGVVLARREPDLRELRARAAWRAAARDARVEQRQLDVVHAPKCAGAD